MTYIVMAYIVMAYIVVAYVIMALYSYGPIQLWPYIVMARLGCQASHFGRETCQSDAVHGAQNSVI